MVWYWSEFSSWLHHHFLYCRGEGDKGTEDDLHMEAQYIHCGEWSNYTRLELSLDLAKCAQKIFHELVLSWRCCAPRRAMVAGCNERPP